MAAGHQLPNTVKHVSPKCKVVVYNWVKREPEKSDSNTLLSETTKLDVSSQLLSCSFSKNMSGPSGSFNFTLSNSPNTGTQDWKDLISKGSWCLIYMSQSDDDLVINPRVGPPVKGVDAVSEAPKIRCIGFIDRISVRSELSSNGALDIIYDVSGRDFGVVYEDSSTWQNLFKFDKLTIDAVRLSGLNILGSKSIDEALDVLHDLMLFPANIKKQDLKIDLNKDTNSLTDVGLQWLIPQQLVVDLGLSQSNEPFWGSMPGIRDFQKTKATLAIASPTDYLFGNIWDNLKKISVPELHELYTETTEDGLPRLFFRPIPFAIDKSNYPIQGEFVTLYKDLDPVVEIPAVDVFGFNVGEDNHARYNSFLVTLSTSLINTADNISNLADSGFPKHATGSIKRHGFRPMHIVAHSLVKNAEKADGASDVKLHKEFNHILEDYWENAVHSESGTARIVGNNAVKVGHVMKFADDTPYLSDKRFYIEGYADTFTVGERGERSWDCTVFLTRGFEEQDLIDNDVQKFSKRNDSFQQGGDFIPSGVIN